MFLNHLNAVEYGVRLLKGWSVKRGSTGASAVKSRMSAAFNVMGSEVSLKTITLPVTIKGRDQHEAAARLSAWEAALAGGKVELQLPDGFLYDAYLKSCGEPSYDLPWLISNTYVLEGVHAARCFLSKRSRMCRLQLREQPRASGAGSRRLYPMGQLPSVWPALHSLAWRRATCSASTA